MRDVQAGYETRVYETDSTTKWQREGFLQSAHCATRMPLQKNTIKKIMNE
jgi:hypothetical protein